jgi:hypothetical protein
MKSAALVLFAFIVPLALAQAPSSASPNLEQLKAMSARFAPTPLRVDISRLSAGDRQALGKLIAAARVLDTLFMRQLWSADMYAQTPTRIAAAPYQIQASGVRARTIGSPISHKAPISADRDETWKRGAPAETIAWMSRK